MHLETLLTTTNNGVFDSHEKDFGVLLASEHLTVGSRDTATVGWQIFKRPCDIVFETERYQEVIAYLDSQSVAKAWTVVKGLLEANPGLKSVLDEGLWLDRTSLLASACNTRAL